MAFVSTPGSFSSARNTASSLSPSKAHGAEFFPVASGVQVPYVGGDEFVIKAPLNLERPSTFMSEDYGVSRLAYNSAVTTAVPHNSNFVFGKVRIDLETPDEQARKLLQILSSNPHTVTDKSAKEISRNYLQKISNGLSFSDEVVHSRAPHTVPYEEIKAQQVFKSKGVVHKSKGKDIGLVGRHDPRGTIKKHIPCHLKAPRKLKPIVKSISAPIDHKQTRKMTQTDLGILSNSDKNNELEKVVSRHEWDEHVLASISKSTAEWIVNEHGGQEKERLGGFLTKRYKPIKPAKPVSNSPNMGDDQQESLESKTSSKEIKRENSIDIHFTPSFTLPQRVGDKKLETDNIYQQELLGGAQHVPRKQNDHNTIVLNTNEKIKFKRHLQENFPQGATPWYPTELKKQTSSTSTIRRQKKGLQRWSNLPTIVQDDGYLSTQMSCSDMNISDLSSEYRLRKKMKEDINIVKIAEEWRSKWFLERKWQYSTTEELLKAMTDINDHVRLAAVAACSKAAMIRKTKKEEPVLQGIVFDKNKETIVTLKATLEPELLDMVTSLLNDKNPQVRIAAAITLYTLKNPCEKAQMVLLWAIEHGGPPEKWAATQCLSLANTICDQVINELVRQLHSDSSVRAVEAGELLAELSRHSGIVQSLIAELLNSSSWKDREAACKVIPKLKGGINKDMTHKLSYIMWNDWNKQVRSAAAQALGKTGNGKLVHDALQNRISSGNERVKVDALKKLSSLGIMTVRLLPAIIECFKSEYVSVRIEASMAVGQLRINDNKILNELLHVASNDRSWKVKAHAIKALGCTGVVNENITQVLLWAMRYEKVPAVRAEACNAVAQLKIRDGRILSVLQDRLVVETDDLVKREAVFTLQTLGVEPTGDLEMIETIRREVERLCTRDAVVSHILEEDNVESYNKDYKRLFTTSEKEKTPTPKIPESRHKERTLPSRATIKSHASPATSQASQRGWDPILGGFQARERMSRAPTPGDLHMEHSYLPMDLNSASSENSSAFGLDDDTIEFSDDDDGVVLSKDESELEPELQSDNQNLATRTTERQESRSLFNFKNRTETTSFEVNDKPNGNDSILSDHAQEEDLCSDVDSSTEDPELLKLADEASEEQSILQHGD